MATLQFEAHHQAPKRSNSGREILYVFPPSGPTPGQPMVPTEVIPPDVADAFQRLRNYSFRDIQHWLKIDRQDEIHRGSVQIGGRASSALNNRMSHAPRLSVASSTHASSRASSVFSAGAKRISVASSNTTYSHMSDPGQLSNWEATLPVSVAPQSQVQVAQAIPLNRKKSATLVTSPSTKSSRTTIVTATRPSPRQRESDVEAKKKYFCTSCNKGFARKYDWKVHEQRYHEQQTQYPCPDCNQILFAETLFKSHHRDAHGCQDCPHAKTVAKEVDVRRRRTAWGCGFCSEYLDDWEKRCDHVAAHYDNGIKREEWDHSKVVIGLLRQPDIDQEWQGLLMQRHGQFPRDLSLRFSKEATGRSHGENAVQLQDLLEFGACPRDIPTIVQLAYEHGYRRTSSVIGMSAAHSSAHTSLLSPPFSVAQDTIMESPVIATSSNESPVQFITPTNSSPMEPFELPMNQAIAYQTPADSRMSSVGPIGDWSQYSQPQIFQQQAFQVQQSNRMSVSYTDKALPPIPPDNMGEDQIPDHSITPRPSNNVMQRHQHLEPDVNDFETWSLVGSTIVEDPSIPNGLFGTDHHFS